MATQSRTVAQVNCHIDLFRVYVKSLGSSSFSTLIRAPREKHKAANVVFMLCDVSSLLSVPPF